MLEGSILQKLKDAHQPGNTEGKRPLNFGVYYKNTLVALCHALEDAILVQDYQPLMITAFQRGKWYLQEAERYGEIAGRSRHITILAATDAGFAEHPTSQLPNVDLVALEATDPVAQEWHLIILSPRYTAMVLCQELSEADYGASGIPQHDLERKFYGLWTFEPNLVLETASLAIAHAQRYHPDLAAQLQQEHEAIASQIHQQHTTDEMTTAQHLGDTVARVIEYLQDGEAGEQASEQVGEWARVNTELEDNLTSNELQAFLRIAQLIDQTDLSNPMAAAEVATLAEAIGQLLDLPAWQLHRLRLAGLLHRIASMQAVRDNLQSSGKRYGDEVEGTVSLACSLVPGVQVLRRMQRLKAIATILTHQTEHWNGTGIPAGLAGDEIPLESRIIALVAHFQQRLAAARASNTASPNPYTVALLQCQQEQGDRWDPKLVEVLTLLVNGLQQGLSLAVAMPKISAGLWLLDSHSTDELIGDEWLGNDTEPLSATTATQEAYGS